MISALSWVPRGAAKSVPVVAEVSEAELAAMREQLEAGPLSEGEDDEEDEDDDLDSEEDQDSEAGADPVAHALAVAAALTSGRAATDGAAVSTVGIEAAMRELDMDNYDDSDEDGNVVSRVLGGSRAELAVDAAGDPYLTLHDDDDDDTTEAEDFTIRPTDLLILAARNEDDVSNLEVWVYEDADTAGEANVYVHHDILLPAFPLCLAWLDCDPRGASDKANMVAIGTMDPGIEIWDLDVVDAVEPVASLGGIDKNSAQAAAAEEQDKKKKKKKKQKKKAALPVLPGSHEDAVLGLSWNREYRNVLASASADSTVKVWDVSKQACEHTLRHHTDKVQSVAWNPAESPVLLTGAFDKTAALVDVRSPNGTPLIWKMSADVEALTWHLQEPTGFLVSAEDGIVACYDARKGEGSDPLFRLAAHNGPTCTLSFSAAAPGLLATGSTDKKVKLWDVSNAQPTMLASQDLGLGAIFSTTFARDAPHLLAVGGAEGSVTVWDVRAVSAVTQRWPHLRRQRQQQQQAAADGPDQQ